MGKRKRWTLLEHIDSPSDPSGLHFDLLLEDGLGCRTWRLAQIPVLNGPALEAIPLPVHKLDWLEVKEAPVSGGRGNAKQVFSGLFVGYLPIAKDDPICVELHGRDLVGTLQIHNKRCKLSVI